MSSGVVYFNHGTKCLSRLAVSIFTLRRHYSGPITILDTGESGGLIQEFTIDARAGVERIRRIELAPVSRHACYVTKASLWRWSPYETTIFLDSDTIIAGDVIPLAAAADASPAGLAITSFSDWTTETLTIRARIEKWREIAPADVDACYRRAWPAINTGVLAWRNQGHERVDGRTVGSLALGCWEELTRLGWRRFIADEIAMQLILPEFADGTTVLPSRWNHSPRYGVASPDGPPVVWHFHGASHLKDSGRPIWLPVWQAALAENFAGLASWSPDHAAVTT